MTYAALELTNLTAGYGRRIFIRDVTLSLPAGLGLCLIGLNGAGKTTLVKALTGLNRPAAGSVRVLGGDPALAATRGSFAFLPERFTPSPLLTGREVMRLTRRAYGLPQNDAEAEARAAALGLGADKLAARVKTYSKGMAQKLGLAAALHCDPALLILDEPYSGLDPLARTQLKQALLAYRHGGGTLVFTSHLLHDVAELADRVALIHEGRLAFYGVPSDLLGAGDAEAAFMAAIA